MITKLRVENFKCLRDVSVELSPFTVLIGKNDTGKSSFLEAVQMLSGLVQDPPAKAPTPVDKLVWRGVDPPWLGWTAEIKATTSNGLPGDASYSLQVAPSAKSPGDIYVKDESLTVAGTNIRAGFERGANHTTLFLDEGATALRRSMEAPQRTAMSFAGSEQGTSTITSVARALRASPIIRFDPERLAEPAAYPTEPGATDREPTLGADGHGLPLLLDAILGSDRGAFDQIERDLCEAVPYVRSIRLKTTTVNGAGRPAFPGKALSFALRAGGHEIPASLASQGVLLFLAYLALVHVATPPSILLVEEPENGIHPRQLQRVAEYLKRLTDPSRGKAAAQIVTATHSPYLLDFVQPEDVLVFGRKESGETVIRPLLSLSGVKERLASGFSLGEMWFNVGEDRLLAEALS